MDLDAAHFGGLHRAFAFSHQIAIPKRSPERLPRRIGALECAAVPERAKPRKNPREGAFMQTRSPPFRADHVGSLVRPPELVQARADYTAGKKTAGELHAVEDSAIRDAVKLQQDVGLQCVTDGEFRRTMWHIDFYKGIGGFTPSGATNQVPFHNKGGEVPLTVEDVRVTGKLRLDKIVFADDFKYLQSAADGAMPKLTIPSPSVLHRRMASSFVDKDVYADMDTFWEDLSDAYRQEVVGLGKLGCTYLQIDDTSFATVCDPEQREHITKMGGDGERAHEYYISLINDAVSARPDGMAITMHTCRGNYKGAWFAEGGYDYIAEAMFNELNVDGFFLEYDDERAGGFEPLRFMPKDKIAVLGLVTTKSATLESKADILRRIDEAAKVIPLEQLCLSPQCGFASVVDGNTGSIAEQRAKLELIVEIAGEVWA
jgi:5-methyltetrahydropteroyltriglutamate--homocysteine methyltransferase